METQKKVNLAKARRYVEEKKARQERDLRQADKETLEKFVFDLAGLLNSGIKIDGLADVRDVVASVERYAQTAADLVAEISRAAAAIPHLDELDLPATIELKQVTDDRLIETLTRIGDQGELVSKLQTLDQAILLLSEVIKAPPPAGQTPEDAQPVRIVLGKEGALYFLESWPMPIFTGGSSSSGGLTDTELRASPLNVTVVSNTLAAGAATSAKQDTNTAAINALPVKATSAYSIAAISNDGTYKYFFFESNSASSKAYYVMRKTIATSIFSYTKGTGGYAAVYQSSILGPSGSPTWASYGNTF